MTHSVPATRGDAVPRRRTFTGTKLPLITTWAQSHNIHMTTRSKAMQLASTINTNFFISRTKMW